MTVGTLHRQEVAAGVLLVDVVHWRDAAQGCSRCAGAAPRYITPYYAANKRLCPTCCQEVNRVHDEHGWPVCGRADIAVT